jgi:hypothetical protein
MPRTTQELKDEIIECLVSYGPQTFEELQEELRSRADDLSRALTLLLKRKRILKTKLKDTTPQYYMMVEGTA